MTVSASKNGETSNGKWFTFYDQAFQVELENGQTFLANYKYTLKEKVDTYSEIKASDYDKFYSQCDKSMVGFVRKQGGSSSMTNHEVKCFYGVKESSDEQSVKETKTQNMKALI